MQACDVREEAHMLLTERGTVTPGKFVIWIQ